MTEFKKFLLNSNYIQNINSGKVLPVNEVQKPFGKSLVNNSKTLYNKENKIKNDNRLTQSNIANLRRFA